MSGVFTHEAFGHFSEADIIEDNPTMREKMRIGAKLGSDVLSITDDPTRPGQLGFYRSDDEGVAARPVALMKDGVLFGRLHSRRTAAEFGEPITGHCVAQDYRFAPIIRMGCIFIEPREKTKDELLGLLGDGLYLCNHMGGATIGESFTFGAQFGFDVKNGKPGRMLRDINISGNLYATMKNLSAVGNDLTLREIGGCGKGQMNFRSCNGAPHVLVDNVVVGGR
jgi:TldD protein